MGDLIRDVDPSALHGPDSRKFEQNVVRAHMLGLSLEGLSRLRSLVEQRQRSAWDVGDLLVAVYGKPPAPGVMDGSREKLAGVADEVGVSISWLIACRITAAAWPRKDRRPTICWPVHRWLSAHDDRAALLADFVTECERAKVTPSTTRLRQWLDPDFGESPEVQPSDLAGTGEVEPPEIETEIEVPVIEVPRRPGRPRLDPVVRVERLALRLDRDALTALVHRLLAVLELQAAG